MRRAVLLWVALACGCGPQSYADFRDQLAKASCDRMIRCGLLGVSERAQCPPMDLIVPPEEVDVAVQKGRLRFFSDAAQSCIDAVNGAPCDDQALAYRVAMHCHHVVEPGVDVGGMCIAGECEGGVCQESQPGCAGVCLGFAEPGMACLDAGPPGNTCDPTVAYCAGTCQQKKQPGEACANDFECGYGWFCIDGKCGDAVFTKVGSACGDTMPPCEENSYCASPGGVCTAQVEKGKPCDGSALACKPGAICRGGTCQPWLDVNQPCTQLGGASGCPTSQACSQGVCVSFAPPQKGLDQRCDDDSGCLSGLFCRFSVCRFRVGVGGSCLGAPTACKDGLTCDATTNTCVQMNCGV
jgi:hypothetical protein